MKLMKKLLLIHWHYFVRETVEFEKINFLTGKNAAGKSTIIDALQLVLLGDTSGAFFNKAASGRGNRTLTGYLRGELGDDEESGFKYLRSGRFTSFIAIEFYDEEKERPFTAGCCFDTYSENDMQKLFFRFDGAMPEHEFIVDNKPMDITALRSFIRENFGAPHSYTTDVNRSFKEDLYGKLGGLQDRFGQLLKKAVSFNPGVDIQQFISEFVCDAQQTVDVSGMQENIRSYKNLEHESAILQERIAVLEQIIASHKNFQSNKESEAIYAYLIEKAKSDIKFAEITDQNDLVKAYTAELANLQAAIASETKQQDELQAERDAMQAKLLSNREAEILKDLETRVEEHQEKIAAFTAESARTFALLTRSLATWANAVNTISQNVRSSDLESLNPLLAERLRIFAGESKQLHTALKKSGLLQGNETAGQSFDHAKASFAEKTVIACGEENLRALSAASGNLRNQSGELTLRLDDELQTAEKTKKELQIEQRKLESGIYHFPQSVIDLKEAIAGRLRSQTTNLQDDALGFYADKAVPVVIVAEAAEIKNKRWRNVIEGYLHTQKFYLIVPPEHFQSALKVYDDIKAKCGIYNTGIVDVEKITAIKPVAEKNSLAEEIETDNPFVRIFLDYTLGRVIKCDKVSQIRSHKTALTDEGMLYQNYVARAMNPQRWAKPAIGQNAIRQRLEDVRHELYALAETIAIVSALKETAAQGKSIRDLSESETAEIVAGARGVNEIPALEKEIEELEKNIAAVDKSALEALRERIKKLEENLESLRTLLDTNKNDCAVLAERLRVSAEETLPKLNAELDGMEAAIQEQYDEKWRTTTGQPRYEKELSARADPQSIAAAFPRELSKSTNAKNAFWEELKDLRKLYNSRYILGYDIQLVENKTWDDAYAELNNIKLPEYLSRIEDARKKAYEQFQEDFLSRLQNNINDAKQQVEGLNNALRGSSFGDDKYLFRIIPKPDYKRYYDMIIDPMLLEGGYNLLSEHFNTKYKDEIAELFSIITNSGSASQDRDDYEKRVAAFTDYRTYVSFDLEVINGAGESQRLSKTMGKKSGGETQTPFYIAVLASFSQLYRIGRDKTASTARLIIFDEAFSKMDGERIVSSIELLRRFKFQVILSAPPDKIGDIAALVDRNLCVLREGKKAMVRGFDPKQIEEMIDV